MESVNSVTEGESPGVPKQVNHEERRREIIEALFRVAARDGLPAVSIRAVAAEAGIPAPRVQYYFENKAQLLDGALELLGTRVIDRGLALIRDAGPDPSPEMWLRGAIAGSQPTADESRDTLVLFYSFFIASMTEPSLQESGVISAQAWIVTYFADLIRQAQERGETRDGVDPEVDARLILFANTGLNLAALVGVHTVDDAAAAMDHLLGKIFRRTD